MKKTWILMTMLLCNAGCDLWSKIGLESKADADASRKRIASFEEDTDAVRKRLSIAEKQIATQTECSLALAAANERQDARLNAVEEDQLSDEERKEFFDGLEKIRNLKYIQVNGGLPPQQPAASYTPPSYQAPAIPAPMPGSLTAFVQPQYQQQQQQQPRRCYLCRCGKYHPCP